MTEMVIQQLLLDAGAEGIDQDLVTVEPHGLEVAADWRTLQSPETYLGHERSPGFAQREVASLGESVGYSAPARLPLNAWGLTGDWTVTPHAVVVDAPGGRIAFQFHARDVNLVMGPASQGASLPFRIFLDGQSAGDAHGSDVASDGSGTADTQRTYQLVRQQGPISDRRFEIEFLEAGVEAYCFTFG